MLDKPIDPETTQQIGPNSNGIIVEDELWVSIAQNVGVWNVTNQRDLIHTLKGHQVPPLPPFTLFDWLGQNPLHLPRGFSSVDWILRHHHSILVHSRRTPLIDSADL